MKGKYKGIMALLYEYIIIVKGDNFEKYSKNI